MSTSEAPEIAYMSASEAPEVAISATPEAREVGDIFKDTTLWGYAWVCKIVNESSSIIKYDNPYAVKNTSGSILPGFEESSNVKGWIPFSRTGMVYEVSYHNTTVKQDCKVHITDPDMSDKPWTLTFTDCGIVNDEPAHPPGDDVELFMTLVFKDTEYSIEASGYSNPLMKWLLKKSQFST